MTARAVVLLAFALSAGAAADTTRMTYSSAPAAEPARGTAGFICLWAIYATLAKAGEDCPNARNPAVQTELERSVSRLEDYARRQSPAGAALMARYRATHIEGHVQACNAEVLQMYEHIAHNAPETLRRETDRLLASSPLVEWGDCL